MSEPMLDLRPAMGIDDDRFFELTGDLLAVIDTNGRFERVNGSWTTGLGFTPAHLIGRRLVEIVHPDDRGRAEAATNAGAEPEGSDMLRFIDRAGAVRSFDWRCRRDETNGRCYLAARDVTSLVESERALRRSAERYRHLFESHPLPMAVWDLETRRIVAVNDAAVRQYGYRREEFLTLTFDRIVHPDDWPRLLDLLPGLTEGSVVKAVFRHRRKNGTELQVELSGHALEYAGRAAHLVMAVDISERRMLEDQLRQALKMEAIGRLAGGIAHDFNNLLTAINGYSQLLVSSLAAEDPRREDAEQIRLAGERAAALTGQLLAFSRRQLLQPEVLDVHEVIHGLAPMIRRLIGAHIELRLVLRARSPLVLADRARLEQVIVNLSVNARDAMPDGGTLSIETSVLDLQTPRRLGQDVAAAGRYVELRVRDTGIGMDAATRRRVFEPFFTTKEPGRGTGLGLATAYGTVRQSGGHLRVTSAPGKGTSFRVALPESAEAPRPIAMDTSPPNVGSGRGTVLVVEDEPTVRALAERVLADAVY
ncbi:MAG TPA: PAS domain S-box protein, partial [Candidatus Limnocylindrales bacterium]|nr:PAS domain S-box protein [Candidatus Limnocylindrales bacterium]